MVYSTKKRMRRKLRGQKLKFKLKPEQKLKKCTFIFFYKRIKMFFEKYSVLFRVFHFIGNIIIVGFGIFYAVIAYLTAWGYSPLSRSDLVPSSIYAGTFYFTFIILNKV